MHLAQGLEDCLTGSWHGMATMLASNEIVHQNFYIYPQPTQDVLENILDGLRVGYGPTDCLARLIKAGLLDQVSCVSWWC